MLGGERNRDHSGETTLNLGEVTLKPGKVVVYNDERTALVVRSPDGQVHPLLELVAGEENLELWEFNNDQSLGLVVEYKTLEPWPSGTLEPCPLYPRRPD